MLPGARAQNKERYDGARQPFDAWRSHDSPSHGRGSGQRSWPLCHSTTVQQARLTAGILLGFGITNAEEQRKASAARVLGAVGEDAKDKLSLRLAPVYIPSIPATTDFNRLGTTPRMSN